MARSRTTARQVIAGARRRTKRLVSRRKPPSQQPAAGPRTWLQRGKASEWRLRPGDASLLRTIDQILGARSKPKLAIITDDPTQRLGLIARPKVVHAADADPSALHVELARLARYDLIVLDTADPDRRRALMLRLSPLTKVGGKFIVARLDNGVGVDQAGPVRALADVLEPAEGSAGRLGLRERELNELGRAIGEVELVSNHAVLTNRTRAYAKLHEPEANALLERAAGRRGRVLARLEGGEFVPTTERRESESPLADSWRKKYDVPDLFLREYRSVVCTPGQVAAQGATLLPDSFRHIGGPRAENRYAPDLNSRFARLADPRKPQQRITEPHFYFDSEFRGHFGHAMTEQLSRLWAFDDAKKRYPNLRILMAINKRRELTDFEIKILEVFGAAREDITFVYEPVRVDTLVAATPMFSQPRYVHPAIGEVWDKLGSTLATEAPDRDYPQRFFIGRRNQKRACRNAGEVEALFASYGFAILYPEDYPLAEQARMFREAEVIGGYAGSGLFNVLFADKPKHLVMVSSENYTAENEWMIAAVQHHKIDVAWCEPELKRPHKRAFHSPYSFNPDREGVFLRKVLEAL